MRNSLTKLADFLRSERCKGVQSLQTSSRAFKRVFTCKIRLRCSRERASQSSEVRKNNNKHRCKFVPEPADLLQEVLEEREKKRLKTDWASHPYGYSANRSTDRTPQTLCARLSFPRLNFVSFSFVGDPEARISLSRLYWSNKLDSFPVRSHSPQQTLTRLSRLASTSKHMDIESTNGFPGFFWGSSVSSGEAVIFS